MSASASASNLSSFEITSGQSSPATLYRASSNTAPTADAGEDFSVDSGASSGLDGSGSSDPDGDPLTYSWTQTEGPSVDLSDPSAVAPSFTAPVLSWSADPATLVFTLVVSDGGLTSEASSVTVTVNPPPPPNTAPTADAGTGQSVASGATVNLDGSGSSDPEDDTLS
ncbi:PKD domain-containing protein, partial [Sedimentimonas flavescens]|nr:PKD domain-containing protein [Sedimentimonas flavescens]